MSNGALPPLRALAISIKTGCAVPMRHSADASASWMPIARSLSPWRATTRAVATTATVAQITLSGIHMEEAAGSEGDSDSDSGGGGAVLVVGLHAPRSPPHATLSSREAKRYWLHISPRLASAL